MLWTCSRFYLRLRVQYIDRLTWRKYKNEEKLCRQGRRQYNIAIHFKMYMKIILFMMITGVLCVINNMLCRAITQANPKWDEDVDSDECFFRAVDMAKFILENEIKSMHSTEHAEQTVRKCLSQQQNGIVVLPKGMPWKAILIPSNAVYVIYPSPRGGYNAQAIPKAIDSQECKRPFPEEWRGERDKLSEITGIPGLTFCHVHGYLLGTETKEAAIEACCKSIK